MTKVVSDKDKKTDVRHNNHGPDGIRKERRGDRFVRWFTLLEKGCLYFSSGCIVLLTALLSFEIVQRKLFNRSLLGIEEILELSMIFITFLALSAVQREEAHLNVDLLYNRIILATWGSYFRFIVLAVSSLFFIVFLVVSVQYVVGMCASGEFTNTLHLPKTVFFVAIPFSVVVFLIRLAIQMISYKSRP